MFLAKFCQKDLVTLAVDHVCSQPNSASTPAYPFLSLTTESVVLRERSDRQDHRLTSIGVDRSCTSNDPEFSNESAPRATADYAQATTFCTKATEPRKRPIKLNRRILDQTRVL